MTATDIRADRLTSVQRKAIMMHFGRLSLDHPAWRDARLAVMAALLGVERVESVTQLSRSEAERLVKALGRCRDCRDLSVYLAWAAIDKPLSANLTA